MIDPDAALADSAAINDAINEAADYRAVASGEGQFAPGQPAKTWDECSPDEKLERLREYVRSRDMAIEDLREPVARLMNHSHGRNGELLAPIVFSSSTYFPPRRYYDPLA